MAWLRRRLFGIAPAEATFARRGFRGSPAVRDHLEAVGMAFLEGYNGAMVSEDPEWLNARLLALPTELQGFAFEGAGMGLQLLDLLLPWRRGRLERFLNGPAERFTYLVQVGAGWALARLRRPAEPVLKRLDPVLGWLIFDGYGFHDGYFNPGQAMLQQRRPRQLAGYAARGFDQGLGRSFWFSNGADVERIALVIRLFAPERRADLWSGVGLAATYAGRGERHSLATLAELAEGYRPHLAQGAAFAAKARLRGGNATPHTEAACQVLCGCSAPDAAAVTDRALEQLPADGHEPAFEVWRRRITRHFAGGSQT